MDLSPFRWVVVGGSSDWRDRPPNVVRTYGLSETGSGVVYDGVPLDGVELRIEPLDGQIHVRGPMLLRTYRDGQDPKSADGWLATGDSGSLDRDGRLQVDGRMADVIVTGGEKVWPSAVEDALRTHPDVAEVAVAGRPDDEWGQRVVAWVVTTGAHEPTLGELRDHVRSTLPSYAAPKQLALVRNLPKTPIGKIRRDLLTDPR